MSVFQHPHLTRGIVKTAKGAFLVSRGLVEAPDEIGEALGWQAVGSDDQTQPELSTSARGRTPGPDKRLMTRKLPAQRLMRVTTSGK